MTLTLRDGSLFLHVPKTGGIWIHKVLYDMDYIKNDEGHEHADLSHLSAEIIQREAVWYQQPPFRSRQRLREQDKMPFLFCFVRHPLRWYESLWRFMRQQHWPRMGREGYWRQWHPKALLNGLGHEDFNTFIANVMEKRPGYLSELYFNYARPEVNFVGQTEHLTEDFLTVLTHLKIPHDPSAIRQRQRANTTAENKSPIVWDQHLQADLLALEKPAMVHFGYEENASEEAVRRQHRALRRIVPLEESR